MKMNKKSGAVLAASAAALLMSGAISAPANAAKEGEVHCYGVNACKGKTGCATAGNACKGQNKCKGSGWVSMSKESCEAIGGSLTEKKK